MNSARLLVACIGLLLCTACSPSGTTDPGEDEDAAGTLANRDKTFRIAIRAFGPFQKAIGREWASFQKDSPCKLELDVVAMDRQPLYEALFEMGGLTGGDWDIALVNTDWLAEAHESGKMLDLAPYIEKDPPEDYPDGWTDSLLRLQQFDGQVIGLPYHDGPECLIYRTDMLESETLQKVHYAKFGRQLEVPETWAEFVHVAKFLNRPEEMLYGTVLAAQADGHNTVHDICLQLWTRGGELFDDGGKIQLNTPQMVRALEFYRSMFQEKHGLHTDCREFDSAKTRELFLHGHAVMMIDRFGLAVACQTSDESKVKGLVAIAPAPHGPGGSSASLNRYWLLSVASGSPHKDVAYQFARYCMSRAADKQRTLEGVVGCRKSTWTDEEVNKEIPYYGKLEALHAAARELPRMANWGELSAVIDWMALEAINTKRPIESIVQEAQQKAEQLQKKKQSVAVTRQTVPTQENEK